MYIVKSYTLYFAKFGSCQLILDNWIFCKIAFFQDINDKQADILPWGVKKSVNPFGRHLWKSFGIPDTKNPASVGRDQLYPFNG